MTPIMALLMTPGRGSFSLGWVLRRSQAGPLGALVHPLRVLVLS